MDGHRAIERLGDYQSKIAALLQSASALLVVEQCDHGKALAALRWQLMRTMREYQLFKHHEIFDRFAASPYLHLADMALAMKTRCIAIGEDYAAHIQRWSNGAAANAWTSYTADSRDIILKIRQHLESEHVQTLVLLNDVGRIRQATGGTSARVTWNKSEKTTPQIQSRDSAF